MSFDANLNVLNHNGETPLFSGVRSQSVRVVKDMLLKGANRNVTNSNQQKPIDLVSQIENEEVKNQLKKTLVSHIRIKVSCLISLLFH